MCMGKGTGNNEHCGDLCGMSGEGVGEDWKEREKGRGGRGLFRALIYSRSCRLKIMFGTLCESSLPRQTHLGEFGCQPWVCLWKEKDTCLHMRSSLRMLRDAYV